MVEPGRVYQSCPPSTYKAEGGSSDANSGYSVSSRLARISLPQDDGGGGGNWGGAMFNGDVSPWQREKAHVASQRTMYHNTANK